MHPELSGQDQNATAYKSVRLLLWEKKKRSEFLTVERGGMSVLTPDPQHTCSTEQLMKGECSTSVGPL